MNDRTFAMFNTMTVTGRVSNLEEVTHNGDSWLAVTLLTELQNDAGAIAITFNTTNGMYSLYKKGYMPNGRMVTVTGHVSSFKSAYLDKNGQPKLLKRPVIHLKQATLFDGCYGPGPKRDEVDVPTGKVTVDPTPSITPSTEELAFWYIALTYPVGAFLHFFYNRFTTTKCYERRTLRWW